VIEIEAWPGSLLTTAKSAPEAISEAAHCLSPWKEAGSSSPGPFVELLEPPRDVGGVEYPAVFHSEDVTLGVPCLRHCLSLLGLP
jgi:hypothetical protein